MSTLFKNIDKISLEERQYARKEETKSDCFCGFVTIVILAAILENVINFCLKKFDEHKSCLPK